MLSKSAQLALGAHTAGIYADMSIDGPEIGTLVAIIDRAKNLPNRKTMGKQNPYCACRLAKEAKKTDTDKRGGQTPKWDQELRFTVHQSPDYYQLKVSVFNDDKKTDLIGETWIDLRTVIIAGGGQSDSWHNLNCKGKYAGEIRIELTYYDTRPKDDAVVERRKEGQKSIETKSQPTSSVSGPRQSRPPKRRPLPANPTGVAPAKTAPTDPATVPRKEPSASNLARVPAPEQSQLSPTKTQRVYETPDDLGQQWASDPRPPHSSSPTRQAAYANSDPSFASNGPGRQVYQAIPDTSYSPVQDNSPTRQQYYHESRPLHHTPGVNHSYQSPQISTPPRQPQEHFIDPRNGNTADVFNQYNTSTSSIPAEDPYSSTSRRSERQSPHPDAELYREPPSHAYESPSRQMIRHTPTPEQGQNQYSHISRKSPNPIPEPHFHNNPESTQHLALENRNHNPKYSTPTKSDVYRDSPLRQSVSQADYYQHRQYIQPHVQDEDDNGPPPPPPAHRDGLTHSHGHEQYRSDQQPVIMPEPLSITPRTSPRPIERDTEYIAYSPNYRNAGHSTEVEQAYSVSPCPSYHSVSQERSYLQDRPTTSNSESVPPSLIAGFDSTLANEPDRMMPDHRQMRHQSTTPSSTSTQVVRSSPVDFPGRRSPRAAVKDSHQIPLRKSVSPQPRPPVDPDSLQGVPFSPDCYDALNPNASLATGLEQPAPPYETVERSMEAARQHEVDKLRSLGPIIGNDGRTIDPSDHLPADTWAPEPVRKPKKPEVVVRFKHAYTSNAVVPRPSTADREQQGRPRSFIASNRSTPPQSAEPYAAGRPRIHKIGPGRPQSYVQPSPNMPRDPSPRAGERGAYGQYSTSPNNGSVISQYSASSQVSRYSPGISQHYHSRPPIPAKVPIQPGSQTYAGMPPGASGELDALSEEMKRIDIGTGHGGRRGRPSFIGGYEQ
ncbi:hypothetical protein LOZ36_002617 [Ophidiomyces ophidiicola]|nr:hypothetical protein LOZ36_002617 [Ophidiomyces ophidiicola]